jgi:carboxyl-terminal processing protease
MRSRVFPIGIRACFGAFALLLAAAAVGQLPTTIAISDPGNQVADVLRHGQQLEIERRWGEALAYYEDAVRQHPQDANLQQRFDAARVHYDLQRRYADRSFRESVSRLPFERALDLYGQVLLKIDSHYVETPRWKDMLDRGTANLDVALAEPAFVDNTVPAGYRLVIDSFRRELWTLMAPQTVKTRAEAAAAVAAAARLAQRRLGMQPTAVVLEYLCGATNALDLYSTYLTPDQLNEVYAQIEGNFVGLGVELKAQDGGLTIVRVISGSPAEEAGVRPGDRIFAVDGRSTASLTTDQAANLLQGSEGSRVQLTLAGPGQTARQTVVERRVVEVPSVDHVKIVDPQYGVPASRKPPPATSTPPCGSSTARA